MSLLRAVGVVVVCLSSTLALAQAAAGVSDERVKLPGAPGSIDGVGENATVEGNQGALRYGVRVEVPAGFPGLTPDLSFTYSSTSPSDVLGIGWSLPTFSIERMTAKGLQRYALDDRFVVDGSQELVRVAENGASATYRARVESGFVRYTWRARGTGAGGSWVAEYPDGRIGYYGADAAGTEETLAQVRVPNTGNVFRWHLTSMVDRFGHEMKLVWTKDVSGTPLLERIDYVYEGATARHSVRFTYEPRADVVSDARPGFELKLDKRLRDVRVFSGSELVRSYVLTYEQDAVSGGATRLARIARFGRNNLAYPVRFSFGYSRTLGGVCDASCEKPFVRDTGTLGVNFATGAATLIDINGDAIPDVLASDANGVHRFHYGRLDGEGQMSFDPTPVFSTKTVGGSAFRLGEPSVQVIDVNGDGFVDMVQPRIPSVLCNTGSGDWADATACTSGSGSPLNITLDDDTSDATQADPLYIRFFDYDNDRRIDFLRTVSPTTTEVLANTPSGFVSTTVDALGAVFDSDPLQLADMNGDGLQDPVRITASTTVTISYRLNLGLGKWTPWRDVTANGLDPSQASRAELQDLNGDGLADLVAVVGNEVKVALNRNGDRFDAVQTIDSSMLGAGAIPARTTGTVVTYADMNGNGSDDVVWIQPGGQISYLELFPVRPNLISRIENDLGWVQLVTYGTSIAELARDVADGKPWPYKVPHAMSVVKQTIDYVTLTGTDTGGLREVNAFRYHAGFYDGVEKQFRGYATVDRVLAAGTAQEGGRFVTDFDVGVTSPVLAGAPLVERVLALPNDVPLRETRYTRAVCAVAEATGSLGFACQRAMTVIHFERDPANALTTRTEQDYDGFGNVTRVRALGVVNRGTPEAPLACEACTASGVFGQACGADCLGDELYTDTEYVVPGMATGGAWIVDRVSKVTTAAVANTPSAETRTFYDGPDFVGLPLGQLTDGFVTRVARRSGPGANDFIDFERSKRDTHGNVAERLEVNATVNDAARGRRLYTYEASGLKLTRVELKLGGPDVEALRRDLAWDGAWGLMAQSSNWYPVVGGAPASSPQLTRYRYDDHGRLARLLEPGDTDQNPTTEFAYELGAPASRIVTFERSSATSGQDVAVARCFDGRGRLYQTRSKLTASLWQVDGMLEFDARGATARRYQGWTSSVGTCEATAPANTRSTRYVYDALGRELKATDPDDAERRTEYRPLVRRFFDELDVAPGSPHADTPTTEVRDGQDRIVAVQRLLTAGGAPATTRVEYDERGRLKTLRDAAGHVRTQTYDFLGRLVRVDDTNGGSTTRTFDAAGNLLTSTDAAGNVVQRSYDPFNRLVAEWSTADEAGTRRTWAYDRLPGCLECTNAGGELVRATWPGTLAPGEDAYGYDLKGRRVYRRRTLGGQSFVVRDQYDGANRLVSTVLPGGLSIDRRYDGAGRLTGVTGVIDEITYDERGLRASLRGTNGATSTYAYDSNEDLTSLVTRSADGSAFLELGLTRRADGTLAAISDGALPGRVRHDAQVTSDAWARPTRIELSRADGPEALSFSFDVIDNLTSQVSSLGAVSRAHLGTLSYDAARPNAVVQTASLSLSYDGAGRVATRGAIALTRDHFGRVVGAQGGAVEGTFEWATEARVARQEGDFRTLYLGEDLELRDGILVAYVRLDDEPLARLETDALAATVLSDLTGDGAVDIADAWLAQAGERGVSTPPGPASPAGALLASAARRLLVEDVTWLHADHLGSVVAATNAAGALVGEQSFYPTGALREANGFVDQLGFTAQSADVSTGLIHFARRELDSATGRWDQPDPMFFEVGQAALEKQGEVLAGYAYVANRFLDLTDPEGLNAVWKPGLKPRQDVPGPTTQPTENPGLKANDAPASRPRAMSDGPEMRSSGSMTEGFKPKGALEKIGNKVMPFATRSVKGSNLTQEQVRAKQRSTARNNGIKVVAIVAVVATLLAAGIAAYASQNLGGGGGGSGGAPPPPDQLTSTNFGSVFGR